ncbi:hypothetical protein [Streptomyces sp. NPDC001652]|uniref:hypothetical protein n=1 Tax=Streptomyces sp. NPDC001652 TaxID=3154393 RepID=UPI00332D23E0
MNDFLGRLAARAVGTRATAQPRLPGRFEPVPPLPDAPEAGQPGSASESADAAVADAGDARALTSPRDGDDVVVAGDDGPRVNTVIVEGDPSVDTFGAEDTSRGDTTVARDAPSPGTALDDGRSKADRQIPVHPDSAVAPVGEEATAFGRAVVARKRADAAEAETDGTRYGRPLEEPVQDTVLSPPARRAITVSDPASFPVPAEPVPLLPVNTEVHAPGVPDPEHGPAADTHTPVVRISIGRLEVRAQLVDTGPPPPVRPLTPDPAPQLSLSDYLRGRQEPR